MFRRGAIIALAVALTGAALLVRLRLGFAEGDAPLRSCSWSRLRRVLTSGGRSAASPPRSSPSWRAPTSCSPPPARSGRRSRRPPSGWSSPSRAPSSPPRSRACSGPAPGSSAPKPCGARARRCSARSATPRGRDLREGPRRPLRFANPATLKLVGKTAEQALGRTDLEFLGDTAAARLVMETDRTVMESGVATEVEEVVPLEDGTERVWLSRKFPYRDASGAVAGLLGIARNHGAHARRGGAARERAPLPVPVHEHERGVRARGGRLRGRGPVRHPLHRDERGVRAAHRAEAERGRRPADARGAPPAEQRWIDAYCGVALTGKALRFESYNRDLDRHFSVFSYSPGPGRFGRSSRT